MKGNHEQIDYYETGLIRLYLFSSPFVLLRFEELSFVKPSTITLSRVDCTFVRYSEILGTTKNQSIVSVIQLSYERKYRPLLMSLSEMISHSTERGFVM